MFVVREITLKVRGQQGRLGTAVCYQKLRFGKTTKPDKTSSSSSSGRTSVSNSKSTRNTPPKDGRHPDPYEAWRPPGQPKSPPIPPEAVAMAEFAVLERKLAANAAPSSSTSRDHGVDVVSSHSSSRRKTVGLGGIEEGGVLESNTGASGRIKTSSLGKASSSSFPRPEEPQEGECCGNGCQNCVWIDYWEDLQKWEEAERMREREEAPPPLS